MPLPDHSDYQYQIDGDTVIGTNTYFKLKRSGFPNFCADPIDNYLNGSEYAGAYRDDTLAKKVFQQKYREIVTKFVRVDIGE